MERRPRIRQGGGVLPVERSFSIVFWLVQQNPASNNLINDWLQASELSLTAAFEVAQRTFKLAAMHGATYLGKSRPGEPVASDGLAWCLVACHSYGLWLARKQNPRFPHELRLGIAGTPAKCAHLNGVGICA